MLTLMSLARADHHNLLNAGNDVQRWWRLVYTVLTGMVELLRVGICGRLCTVCTLLIIVDSVDLCQVAVLSHFCFCLFSFIFYYHFVCGPMSSKIFVSLNCELS